MVPIKLVYASDGCALHVHAYYILMSYLNLCLFFLSLQFENLGPHGTKIIVYNLWMNDEGIYELNFDDDLEV